jgi:hypothetical protein
MNPANPPANKAIDTRWLRWGLASIAFLLTLIAVELSILIGPTQPRALGQIPDSGAQLNQLIESNKQIGRTVQQILDHLRTGEIKVAASGADREPRGAAAPAAQTHKSVTKSRPAASRSK